MKKEINKSVDWESSKNIHGYRASQRLIYRYWIQVLMKEGFALEESPNFVNWCDPESDNFMFTTEQEESWSHAHLKLCHWYLEMPKDETPLHEELNRRAVDPTYVWSSVGGPPQTAGQDVPASRGTGRASKGAVKAATAKGAVPKSNAASKGTKRGAPTTGRAVSKKGKLGDAGTDETAGPPDVDATAAVSEAKSSKSNSQSRPSHGPSFSQGIRQSLAIRDMSGRPSESLILNECFTNFIEVQSSQGRERFERFAKKVR